MRDHLHRLDEIVIHTRGEDGSWAVRPLWVVVVAGQAYVRSAFGTRSRWFRRVREGAAVRVETLDGIAPVSLEPVHDAGLDDLVSQAYRTKYGPRWPGPVETLVGPTARASRCPPARILSTSCHGLPTSAERHWPTPGGS